MSCTYKKKSDNAAYVEIAASEAIKTQGIIANSQNNGVASEQEFPLSEVDLTQTKLFSTTNRQGRPTLVLAPFTRPDKLPLKRRTTQPQKSVKMDPMQEANATLDIVRNVPSGFWDFWSNRRYRGRRLEIYVRDWKRARGESPNRDLGVSKSTAIGPNIQNSCPELMEFGESELRKLMSLHALTSDPRWIRLSNDLPRIQERLRRRNETLLGACSQSFWH
ncbi:hypothetical protein PIB30_014880 [Stylosanthes scabra]|uniref:Uncharacterized protein n=1 Tax=Stylosanthes scabra TaxID=79078 RepID=A0ABU6T6J4_9FABA|nr:hypothetical protein [Stylosanthes scabra]